MSTPSRQITIALSDGLQPIKIVPGETLLITVTSGIVRFLELEDILFCHDSTALLPAAASVEDDDPVDDVEEIGIGVIARCLAYLKESRKKFLITGHADTTGSEEYNVNISLLRAQCALALLTGDRISFKEKANSPHIADKNKRATVQMEAYKAILGFAFRQFGWPCMIEQNHNDYWAAVKMFQRCYNDDGFLDAPEGEELAVDADWGPKTWGAVFDCYEYVLALQLGVKDIKGLHTFRSTLNLETRSIIAGKPVIGCGEYHPIEAASKDNYRSKTNKRVEILFFDKDELPDLSCAGGSCSKKECQLYNTALLPRSSLPRADWQSTLMCGTYRKERKMIFRSPELLAGQKVEFSTYVLDGTVRKSVFLNRSIIASEDRYVEMVLDETVEELVSQIPVLKDGEYFPNFSLQFEAVYNGLVFPSPRLPFHGEKRIFRYYS
jgi:hypothetical protein